MVKTRSQTPTITIKKEESKEDLKCTQLLNGLSKTTAKTGSITKSRKTLKDTKSPLSVSKVNLKKRKTSPSSPIPKTPIKIIPEQIKQLIGYIEDEKMTIKDASKKVNICSNTGSRYYKMYLDDPERKIPEPAAPSTNLCKPFTQDQINMLIRYIVNDKMNVTAASKKANMSTKAGHKYYNKYIQDPERKIPSPKNPSMNGYDLCTHEQIKAFIGYIVDDKMSIVKATRKVNISESTGLKYYRIYMEDPEHKIPTPWRPTRNSTKTCTQEEIKSLINHIVVDRISVSAASRKVNINISTGRKYYKMYLTDPERKIPEPLKRASAKPCTQDQINALIGYIVDDNLSVAEASKRINVGVRAGRRYYSLYTQEHKIPTPRYRTINHNKPHTQELIDTLIRYIVDDKMTVSEASRKVNISEKTGSKYYKWYKENPGQVMPRPRKPTSNRLRGKACTQDQIEALINYIVNDNMSISEASKKANTNYTAGLKYYKRYMNDPQRKIPESLSKIRASQGPRGKNKPCTQEQINAFIGHIANDKMNMAAAARKVGMTLYFSAKYYSMYLKDPNHKIPNLKPPGRSGDMYSKDRINELIHYIDHDKMSIKNAADKSKISIKTARKYYNKYGSNLK